MTLSDFAIRNLKPSDKPRKVSDGGWLYLHVLPSGAKIWRMGYRHDGKEKTHTIGSYPQVSLSDARRARDEARAKIEADEALVVAKSSPEPTFLECAQIWHRKWSVNVTPAHAALVWRRLELNVFPALGSTPIRKLTTPKILAALQPMEDRGVLDMLKRARQGIAEITAMAVASGLIDTDPTYRLEKAVTRPKRTEHFARMPFSLMQEFMPKLYAYEGDPMTRDALLLTIFTWTRTNEIRFARWSEFDGDTWRIPAERMKAGRPHIIPLSEQAQQVLSLVPRNPRSEFVFWSNSSKTGTLSENTMLFALARLGYKGKATVHGFRSTASTWANEQMLSETQRRYDADWIELALAHVENNRVRGAYNSALYIEARRRMLQDWADALPHVTSD